MKNLKILSVSLLMCLTLSTSAQVTQIWDSNKYESQTLHNIKVDNDKLFIFTSAGVFEQALDEYGNLIGNGFELSKLFENFCYDARDFIQSGDKIIVVTNNSPQEGYAIFKSIDNGFSWIDKTDSFGSHPERITLCQCYYNRNELYLKSKNKLIYSENFGEDFEKTADIYSNIYDCSKFDSKILVYSTDYLPWQEYHFYISFDKGKNIHSAVENFMMTKDIAFHYSDPNKIIVAGNKIVVSEDGGKTWQNINRNSEELYDRTIIHNYEFSKSGSDRLYITDNNHLYYSEDYGMTWNELYVLNLTGGDKIKDFIQYSKMIYAYTTFGKVYQMSLGDLEASVETIGVGNENVSVSVEGNNLRINSQSEISNIEIYSIGGIKLLSQAMTDGTVDIANLLQGIYIARLQTADGRSLSVKFNK